MDGGFQGDAAGAALAVKDGTIPLLGYVPVRFKQLIVRKSSILAPAQRIASKS